MNAQSLSLGDYLVALFKDMTSVKGTTPKHGGNWPPSAQFAIEFTVHDKQFPQVVHEPVVSYFDDFTAVCDFLDGKREWIKGTDFDFSMDYDLYQWCWGPDFMYSDNL